jgi:hypothetical protein
MKSQWIAFCMLILCSQMDAKTLFLAHFDKDVKPEIAGNPDASAKGEVKISLEGKWGGALDASYSGERDWSLYYNALDNYQPLKGTVEMWVKPKWAPSEERYAPLVNIHGPSTFQRSGFLLFKYTTQASLTIAIYNEQNGPAKGPDYVGGRPVTWEPNTWHHVAMTWDAEAKIVQIFVDGVLDARLEGERVVLGKEVTDRIYVGCMHGGKETAGALIDEFRISDQVLWEGTKVGESVFDPPSKPYSKTDENKGVSPGGKP